MLDLAHTEPFAIGGRRNCFVHPDDDSRCVKVIPPDKRPALLRQSQVWWKRFHRDQYYDENVQDLRIYRYLLARCGEQLHQHLPRVFGFVETDIGEGLEVELIRDADGRISLSGKEYTIENGITETTLRAIDELEAFLIQHGIQFRDPFPHNLTFQESPDGGLRLFVVDGLARAPWGPLSLLPRSLLADRIRKKIARLRKGLKRTDDNRKAGVTPKTKGLLLKR
jgi:hypothetical protein